MMALWFNEVREAMRAMMVGEEVGLSFVVNGVLEISSDVKARKRWGRASRVWSDERRVCERSRVWMLGRDRALLVSSVAMGLERRIRVSRLGCSTTRKSSDEMSFELRLRMLRGKEESPETGVSGVESWLAQRDSDRRLCILNGANSSASFQKM